MLVTIFSDASCDPSGLAAWAGWAKSDRRQRAWSGLFKDRIGCSSDVAEAMAAVNAVKRALSEGVGARGDKLLIQTDNNSVPAILDGTFRRHPAASEQVLWRLKIFGVFSELLDEHALKHEWRHVKAHRGSTTPRNAVNSGCDVEARRVLRAALQARQGRLFA